MKSLFQSLTTTINKIERDQLESLNTNINNLDKIKQFDELVYKNKKVAPYSNLSNSLKTTPNKPLTPAGLMLHTTTERHSNKRDLTSSIKSNQRTMELFTGTQPEYKNKKENTAMFKPQSTLHDSNTFNSLTRNRYIPSNKNNDGNLPFDSKIKIKPGLTIDEQLGNYHTYRVNPKNIDEIKSNNNKKVTYDGIKIESIKKGNLRQIDPNITKFKQKDFIEKNFTDLLPTKSAVEMGYTEKNYTKKITNRNEKQSNHYGPKISHTLGETTNNSMTKSKNPNKSTYQNDFSRSIKNTGGNSFINSMNQSKTPINKDMTVENYTNVSNETKNYLHNNIKTAPTMRENTNTDTVQYNITNNKSASYVKSNDMKLVKTQREFLYDSGNQSNITNYSSGKIINKDTTKVTNRNINSNTDNNRVNHNSRGSNVLYNKNPLKTTIKESTEMNKFNGTISNSTSNYITNDNELNTTNRETIETYDNPIISTSNNVIYNNYHNVPDSTIKETTAQSIEIQPSNHQISYIKSNDTSRITTKQQTEINTTSKPLNNNNSIYIRNNDMAKSTLKEGVEINTYISNVKSNIESAGKDHSAAENMTSNDKRNTKKNNRKYNGSTSTNRVYIDSNTVNLKDNIHFEYYTPPHLTLDNTTKEINIGRVENNKKINKNIDYSINEVFINTLDKNPYAIKFNYEN